MGSDYDPFGDLTRFASRTWKMSRWSYQAGRNWRAGRVAREVEREFGPEVAQAVEAAIRNGQDYGPILDRARRAQAERAERDRLLANPPPLHGSAAWATPDELRHLLKGREAFDTPSSILLGAYTDASRFNQVSFVHWDEDGHLLTIAPTRSGKAVTTVQRHPELAPWRHEELTPFRVAQTGVGCGAGAGFCKSPLRRFSRRR